MLARLMWLLVWIVANVVYGSMVRDGEHGFKRLAAFYLGWPGTFLSYLSIKQTRRVSDLEVEPRVRAQLELEEERDLLLEIRRDRARRIAKSKGGDGEAAGEEA